MTGRGTIAELRRHVEAIDRAEERGARLYMNEMQRRLHGASVRLADGRIGDADVIGWPEPAEVVAGPAGRPPLLIDVPTLGVRMREAAVIAAAHAVVLAQRQHHRFGGRSTYDALAKACDTLSAALGEGDR